jgi:hypothetical protein
MKISSKSRALAALIAATTFSAFIPTASASNATNTIADITVDSGAQYARVYLNGPTVTGRPACHNAVFVTHFAFDISTAKGKALLSVATAAFLAGKSVFITGSNTCINPGSGNMESISSLAILQ